MSMALINIEHGERPGTLSCPQTREGWAQVSKLDSFTLSVLAAAPQGKAAQGLFVFPFTPWAVFHSEAAPLSDLKKKMCKKRGRKWPPTSNENGKICDCRAWRCMPGNSSRSMGKKIRESEGSLGYTASP